MILICPSQLFFCSLVIYNTLIFYHDLCKMGQLSNRVSQLSNTSKVLVDSTNVMTTNKRQKYVNCRHFITLPCFLSYLTNKFL